MKNNPPSPAHARAAALRAEGKSLREIAARLEAEAVPFPNPNSKKWNHRLVRTTLQQLDDPEPSPDPPPATLRLRIEGPWIAADVGLWESLILQVWEERDNDQGSTMHRLPVSEAVQALPPAQQARTQLWESLTRLASSRVIWTLHREEVRLDLAASLISGAVGATALYFQFPVALLLLVNDPPQFARLKELLRARKAG